MAQGESDEQLYWFHPEVRTVFPLDVPLHLNRSNRRLWRQHQYRLSVNEAFETVMQACRENRDGCWISDRIIQLYTQLHQAGHAISLECWQEEVLVGGIYGVSLGGAFCGESMFSRQSGAGKIALTALHNALRTAGYQLFDVQYTNAHLTQFKPVELARESYLEELHAALEVVPHKLDISIR